MVFIPPWNHWPNPIRNVETLITYSPSITMFPRWNLWIGLEIPWRQHGNSSPEISSSKYCFQQSLHGHGIAYICTPTSSKRFKGLLPRRGDVTLATWRSRSECRKDNLLSRLQSYENTTHHHNIIFPTVPTPRTLDKKHACKAAL